MRRSFVALSFFAVLLFIYACGDAGLTTTSNNAPARTNTNAGNSASQPTPAPTMSELAAGKDLYTKNCANCHRESGEGGPVEIEGKKLDPDNLTSPAIKKMTDEKMLGYISDGIEDEGMPAFKGRLSDEQMRQVVRYIRVELQKQAAPASNEAAGVQ